MTMNDSVLLRVKTSEEKQAQKIRMFVDEYADLTLESERIKARMEWLRGFFETMATDDLKDTKLLTAVYWGSRNSRITVTNSATVKSDSLSMVRNVLGGIAQDFIKTETVDKMTDPCKKFLAMVVQGNYTQGSLENTIHSITDDPKIQATLHKKLKGQYEKDKAMLMKLVDLDEKDASDWAYLVSEVINWERLIQRLRAAQWKGTTQEAVDAIRAAVIVEDSLKVGFDLE